MRRLHDSLTQVFLVVLTKYNSNFFLESQVAECSMENVMHRDYVG